jgi:hypothetical protein
MKIKYRNETLTPNQSEYCSDCAIYKYVGVNETCSGLCYLLHLFEGLGVVNDCEVLEL